MLRGQGSTEYLILLAVVITIALISVALLGFFPALTPEAKLNQSSAYWKGGNPIAVTDAKAWENGTLTLMVQNNGVESVAISAVRIAGNSPPITQVYLGPGQRRPLEMGANLNSTALICEQSLSFTYSTSKFTGLVQQGSRNLVIRCPASVTGVPPPPPPGCPGPHEGESCAAVNCCPDEGLTCCSPGNICMTSCGPACSDFGEECSVSSECCYGFCNPSKLCACIPDGTGGCDDDLDCCAASTCNSGTCSSCGISGAPCSSNGDCCLGLYCGPSSRCVSCLGGGEIGCDEDSDCCSGLTCNILSGGKCE